MNHKKKHPYIYSNNEHQLNILNTNPQLNPSHVCKSFQKSFQKYEKYFCFFFPKWSIIFPEKCKTICENKEVLCRVLFPRYIPFVQPQPLLSATPVALFDGGNRIPHNT